MSNTKDTPMDYKQCECGGDIIMFTPDLDICKKCGKPYEPGAAPDLLKENQELKLELQKQKELVDTLKRAMIMGGDLYSKITVDDEPFTPYQLALQEIEKQKELNAELVNGLKRASNFIDNGQVKADMESLIKKSSEI